jgi:hypothetical protein
VDMPICDDTTVDALSRGDKAVDGGGVGAVGGVVMGEDESDGLLHGSTTRADKTHYMLNSAHSGVVVRTDGSEPVPGDSHVRETDPTRDIDHSSQQDNVKRFLLGRQMIVVPMGFLFAQLTHYSDCPGNLIWLPPALYFPVITVGIPGVLILLQFAQLAPQLVAEKSPIRFLDMIGCYTLAYVALCIESVGVTEAAWVVYKAVEVSTQPIAEKPPLSRPPDTQEENEA